MPMLVLAMSDRQIFPFAGWLPLGWPPLLGTVVSAVYLRWAAGSAAATAARGVVGTAAAAAALAAAAGAKTEVVAKDTFGVLSAVGTAAVVAGAAAPAMRAVRKPTKTCERANSA